MKNTALFLLTAILSVGTAFAQVDKKAKDLLDKVSAKTKSYNA
jgi:hypothetical protein